MTFCFVLRCCLGGYKIHCEGVSMSRHTCTLSKIFQFIRTYHCSKQGSLTTVGLDAPTLKVVTVGNMMMISSSENELRERQAGSENVRYKIGM
jgi:hypothetical protein